MHVALHHQSSPSLGLVLLVTLALLAGHPQAALGDGEDLTPHVLQSSILSPELTWLNYLGGGSTNDSGKGIALDKQGNIYVTGYTTSIDWPTGEMKSPYNGGKDVFVAKLSPDGTLLWSTDLGGSDDDIGEAIAIDGGGNIIVCGETKSDGWISGGYDTTFHGNTIPFKNFDGFLIKLSPSGDPIWSTYMGGPANEYAYDVATDDSGDVCVVGYSGSTSWLKNGFNTTLNSGGDGFVAKYSASGQMLWGSYLGGKYEDYGFGVAVDNAGNVLAAGFIGAVNGITGADWISGGYSTASGAMFNGFVVKLSPDGQHLWSTYLSDNSRIPGDTECYDIATDFAGNVLVAGRTDMEGWVSGGYDTSFNDKSSKCDAFLVKLSPDGQHLWSTYMGGDGEDQAKRIAVDGAGNVCVTGISASSGWVSGGFDTVQNGDEDVFLVRVSPAGRLLWSTFVGQTNLDHGYGIAVDGPGNVFLTGSSRHFVDAFQEDIFVAKITVAGSLRVTLAPPEAVAAGVQWRRVGTTTWYDSGTMESDIPTGPYDVEFKTASGWEPPARKPIDISNGQTTLTSETYTRQTSVPLQSWSRY